MSAEQKNGSPRASKVVVEAAGDVFDEVLMLAGLQMQLGMADFREARTRLTRATVILAAGLAFILGSVPVLLAGIALGLNQLAGWPLWVALLVSGAATLVIAGLACWWSVVALQRSMKVFERSQEQLAMNIEKIRTVVRRDRKPHASARASFRGEEPAAPNQPR